MATLRQKLARLERKRNSLTLTILVTKGDKKKKYISTRQTLIDEIEDLKHTITNEEARHAESKS